MDPRKVRKKWQFMYNAFLFNQVDVEAIKSINQKGDIFSFWNALSNFKLHFATTRSFTFSGFNLAPLGVTTLPATEKTRCSDLDEAAGTGKTTLTSLARRGNCVSWCFPHPSWSTEDSSSGNSWKDFVPNFLAHWCSKKVVQVVQIRGRGGLR